MVVQRYVGGDPKGSWSVWFKSSMRTGPSVEVVHEATWTTFVYDPKDDEWWKHPDRHQKSPPANIRRKAENAWRKGTASFDTPPEAQTTG